MSAEAYLRATIEMRHMAGMADHPTWRFSSVEALVLHYGHQFEPAPLPAGLRRGKMGNCFSNALHGSLDRGLVYVEGYAHGKILTTLHAWNTDEAARAAYDPTWKDGSDYFGIAFEPRWVAATMVSTGTYGLLGAGTPKTRDLVISLLRDGLPAEALADETCCPDEKGIASTGSN